MSRPKNAMEIFNLLDKSNCGECGDKTCLAFAGSVFLCKKSLDECPKLDAETIQEYQNGAERTNTIEESRDEHIEMLKKEVSKLDFREAAERTGAWLNGDRLTLKILGKDFSVDREGKLRTDIHVNPWVAAPFLDYVLNGEGVEPTGNWASFRELKDGKERYPLFQKRCEEAMRRVADIYTDLFDELIHLFNAKQVEEQFESDISVVLHPFPKVPVMICYWAPEDGIESSLNVFFDETADRNLSIGSIFGLGAGLALMFDKLAMRHGFSEAATLR